ncbi:hypothetical protein C4580_01285 [Candidatus Woesearchaeota archaeon]|nr:MAG: hypothetical protein C4580_01285 [Candidatus Woesearchaeota archaeon]
MKLKIEDFLFPEVLSDTRVSAWRATKLLIAAVAGFPAAFSFDFCFKSVANAAVRCQNIPTGNNSKMSSILSIVKQ